jgi:lysophospholipase L1-like esterase
MFRILVTALLSALVATSAFAAEPRVSAVTAPPPILAPLPASTVGRVVVERVGGRDVYRHQWPGVYFDAAFEGPALYFSVGPGETILHVVVDGQARATLAKPAGLYRIDGLGEGRHAVRIQVATESQAGPNRFDGFALPEGSKALPAVRPARQIEFIGDSHTVGYGNTSPSRDCTQAEIWATTDNSRAYGALTAERHGADYRVNAISGRGIVRNYNGSPGDTLPTAYPFALFDRKTRDADPAWRPQLVVISLGTNDFSTPLNPGEKWSTRADLRVDYERTYVAFVQGLRVRYPQARFLLWSTDGAEGEIQVRARNVAASLRAAGETRVDFVAIDGLAMTGCQWHPSEADDRRIADALAVAIEGDPDVWATTAR